MTSISLSLSLSLQRRISAESRAGNDELQHYIHPDSFNLSTYVLAMGRDEEERWRMARGRKNEDTYIEPDRTSRAPE